MRYWLKVERVEFRHYQIEAESIEEAAAAYEEGDYVQPDRSYYDDDGETIKVVCDESGDVTVAFKAAVEANQ